MPGDDWQQFANLCALVGMGSAPKYTEVPCEFQIDLGQQTTGFFVNAMDPLSDLELMSPLHFPHALEPQTYPAE
jgi:hypothetical protein